MRRTVVLVAVVMAVSGGSACGSAPTDESVTASTQPSSSASPTTDSAAVTSPTATSAVSEATTSEIEASEVAAAPTFVECYLADGSGLMSDGSIIYVESCDESAGGPLLLEDGRSIYDAIPTVDLDDIPIADGGTCPAARCGYGHDENGNPNPSSGEIQTKHGCDEGYITDPSLCTAVNDKFDW